MVKRKIIFFLCMLFCLNAYGEDNQSASPASAKDKPQKGYQKKTWHISLIAAYSSSTIYRGALIRTTDVLILAPHVIYKDALTFGEEGLTYFKPIGKSHVFSGGLSFFNDGKPTGPIIRLNSYQADFKNQRDFSMGAFVKYSFVLKRKYSASVVYHKDFLEHFGDYVYIKAAIMPIPLLALGGGYGLGSRDNNQYVYGPEAVWGSGHMDIFGTFMYPMFKGKLMLITGVKMSYILQDENQKADYVRENNFNTNFSSAISYTF